jgi:pimeloyl-ACP methyl ester carboxylesterase
MVMPGLSNDQARMPFSYAWSLTVDWFTLTLIVLGSLLLAAVAGWLVFLHRCKHSYRPIILRIFEEKPFFKASQSFPSAEGEEYEIKTHDGLTLAACHIRSEAAEKKGLILFAPEYGSSRWSSIHYAGHLLEAGYDLFAFDFRNQGDSQSLEGYEPLQWVTQHEVSDVRAAIEFLKQAPFCPADGIGFFGISRGAGAGIVACSGDPFVKCLVTDGAFGTVATMIRFMIKWVSIYSSKINVHKWSPKWAYGLLALSTLNEVHRRRQLAFPSVRNALRRLSNHKQRFYQIHGNADGYIRPEIALDLQNAAPKNLRQLWMVDGAKHNQAIEIAEDEYKLFTTSFFTEHLVTEAAPQSIPNFEVEQARDARRGSNYSTAGI